MDWQPTMVLATLVWRRRRPRDYIVPFEDIVLTRVRITVFDRVPLNVEVLFGQLVRLVYAASTTYASKRRL